MENVILRAIEGLREDMNLKFDSSFEEVDNQRNQLKENTQILKRLEHPWPRSIEQVTIRYRLI